MLFVASLAVAAYCFGQVPKPTGYPDVNVRATLTDGSQLQGVPKLTTLTLVTTFGKHDIPLALVAALDFTKEGAKVRFHNKDVLSGKLENASLEIKTIFNDVRLDFAQLKSVQFSTQRGGGRVMNEPGLLLHALLDSDSEDLGLFDARLEARNVRIIEGREGSNAMLLDSEDTQVIIHLPFAPYPMPEGTVEFWAKIANPHKRFNGGYKQPLFFNIECQELNYRNHFFFGFSSNNGSGGGGLGGSLYGSASIATHTAGAVASVAETGVLGDTPDGWHHYAVVWKRDGFEFPEAQGKTFLLAVDGKVIVSAGSRGVANVQEAVGKKTQCMLHEKKYFDPAASIAMADFKIWDHAKFPQADF